MAAIQFVPAVREKVGLIIGVMGGTGSGKTLTGLLLARGLCGGDDSKIAVLDTEAGRALHYAPPKGAKPSEFTFGFMHADLKPPFTPEAYIEAIETANAAGFEAIVIDSASHEYAGDGGLDDIHEAELDRMAGDDDSKRDRLSIMAWKRPKQRHKKFVARLLQSRAHLILCFRAEEKMKISKVKEGNFNKTVIIAAEDLAINQRWVPVTEKRLPFELTLSLLFTVDRPGVAIPIKLEAQHRQAVPLDRPIGEAAGRALREWSYGGTTPAMTQPGDLEEMPAAWGSWGLEERGTYKANKGIESFRQWWRSLSAEEKAKLDPKLPEWKEAAARITP